MKKVILLSLLFFSLCFCFAKEAEKLPEIPWRAIVETQNAHLLNIWKTDIRVKLFGNYTKNDSLMVENAISELNKLTQTIHIRMSPYDRGDLEIFFLDSTNSSVYKQIITLKSNEKSNYTSYTMSYNDIYGSRLSAQAINMKLIPEESKQNFLTNTLAFDLFPVYWFDNQYWKNKQLNEEVDATIFRSIDITERDKIFFSGMQEYDKKLLKAVYSPDFENNLILAKRQFNPIVIPDWVRSNSRDFLLLPFGILLFILIALFIEFTKKIGLLVSNKLLLFNINGVIGLLIIGMIVTFYSALSDSLKYNTLITYRLWHNIIGVLIVSQVIGLPAINLLRLIEIVIHKNTHKKLLKIVLIFLSTGLLPFGAMFVAIYYTTERPFQISETKSISYFFLACMVVATIRAVISYFYFKEKDLILENETKLSNLRELKSRAELNALHSRINPHFLYNSLNSIAGLAHEDADKTEHMALSLSKLFRYSINKDQSDWTTFKEEMEMVRIYLEVEKVRFDDRLSYSVELPRELEDYKIPRFMIQPLVENAVKHGISKSVKSGQIKVAVTQEGKKLFISVSDDGPAFPNDLAPGFGIQSIYDKLEILYKDKFEMNFINSPQKQVLIKLN